MDPEPSLPLNPWLSMWTRPRETVQVLVERAPEHRILLLAALSGINAVLDRSSGESAGDTLPMIAVLSLALIIGPLAGIIGLYISAALILWTGRWIGGMADDAEIRTAIAWSNVPQLWAMVLWVPLLLFLGPETFTTETPRMDAQPLLLGLLLLVGLVHMVTGIWSLVLFLIGLSQVQRFSVWRALGNALLAVLVVAVPIVLVVAFVLALTT